MTKERRAVRDTLLAEGIKEERVDNLLAEYDAGTEVIRTSTKKHHTAEYQARKQVRDVMFHLGVPAQVLDDYRNSVQPVHTTEVLRRQVRAQEAELVALRAQCAEAEKSTEEVAKQEVAKPKATK